MGQFSIGNGFHFSVQHGNFSFLCKGKCAFAWWITANVPSLRKKQQIVYLTSLTLLLTRAGVTAQSTLLHDISLYFENRKLPDFIVCDPPDHSRIEKLKLRMTKNSCADSASAV
jgi:hypothetical protein